ncbi:hypothetical protein NPX13_g11 [Xylaria arbuscula]|uniref:Uncharacterized protein n=1 Tax=Xylaria arbuscula TaxID=114810 RepID=A0A9W8NP09_9PEZI|nr:hypothetical protein NPX13_g11 [Xylaria arbuscula]
MTVKGKRIPKRWSEEEDCILHEETQKQELAGDGKDWHRVAARLPGRTNKDCRKRWVNKVCGSLKKGSWDKAEDESLMDAVDKYGQRWTLVASDVAFRSPDQCAKRWQSKLDPNLEHRGWTLQEDELLLSLVRENGREWKMFQERNFSKRSTNELKNRYTGLTRKTKITYSRSEGLNLSPSSGSFSLDYNTDTEDHGLWGTPISLHDHMRNTSDDSIMNPLFQQGLTMDWLNTIDNSCMWMDTLSHEPDRTMEDILPSEYLIQSENSISTEELCTPSPITPLDISPTTLGLEQASELTSPSTWPGLDFKQDVIGQDAMLLESSYAMNSAALGDDVLASIQTDSCNTSFTDETRASESMSTPIESNVGRVTLVIDGCNRDTLDNLLNLTRSLKGQTRIEIN